MYNPLAFGGGNGGILTLAGPIGAARAAEELPPVGALGSSTFSQVPAEELPADFSGVDTAGSDLPSNNNACLRASSAAINACT